MQIEVSLGFSDVERPRVALLYWQAFGRKLNVPLGPETKAIAFLKRVLNPSFAICARQDGQLVGVAGFKTSTGSLVGGTLGDLWQVYGLSCIWRVPLVALLERELEAGTLLMDGIFVDQSARGSGIGTLLLASIKDEAERQGKDRIRLDVIDTNPRARALYERVGFEETRIQNLGPLRMIFGFSKASEMVLDLPQSRS